MLDRTISHYHITSQLGEGGMGVVYEAEDTNLGRHVALKFLTPALANDENLLARFQREARAASALNHPNICTIHGIEQFESQHFIVMELLDGEALADRIRRGPIDIETLSHSRCTDRRRARVGTLQRNRASRSEAGEHLRHLARAGKDSRLRRRQDRSITTHPTLTPSWRQYAKIS